MSSSSHREHREIRLERWAGRAFYVVSCPFRVDLPLDLSGCIVSALQEAANAGHRRIPGGLLLATDANRGGILLEVDPACSAADTLTWLDGDVLTRALPPAPRAPLRPEVEQLVTWSNELGRDVASFYVGFTPDAAPRAFKPSRLLATLDGGTVVEHFEVRTRREYQMPARLRERRATLAR